MRKISLKGLRKKADRIFSEYIRRRDKGICCTCYKSFDWKHKCDAGHWIPRVQWGTRYDERNSHCQCFYCNRYGHPQDEYAAFMTNKYGLHIMNELRKQKHLTLVEFVQQILFCPDITTTREAYEMIIGHYSLKLEKLK